jgi:iron complex outermembrane receptor protein/hemoglobin/transferrin/lactoferrin receptor protein
MTVRVAFAFVMVFAFFMFREDAEAQSLPPTARFGARARGVPRVRHAESRGRSTSAVTRRDREERLPRSAPDALRYEPGVTVQQTSHGQASPYVRGLTGQQVLLVFDDVRLNNGIYRQGPNQYFFTVDERTLERIEVLRGSASTRYGSDALGGVITATPIAPRLDPGVTSLRLRPRGFAGLTSADGEWGGRAQVDAQLGESVGVLGGVGYRDVGLLESGGVVSNPGELAPVVPRFASDGRTQLGTGFREATFDARLVARLRRRLQAIAAVYGYRQYDAPRTDKCPPPEQRIGACLTIAEQFRTLAYGALRGDAGRELRDVSLTASYQRYHERRVNDFPAAFVRTSGRDDVDTLGLAFHASTRRFALGRAAEGSDFEPGLTLRYGLDAYRDTVASTAVFTFTDVGITLPELRGQYVDGSWFAQGGVFAEGELAPFPWLTVRAGIRLGGARAHAPPDVESGTRAVDLATSALVGRGGVEVALSDQVTVLANVDQGFRAPNLDDLTARSITGPGYQFENPTLEAERSLGGELGVRVEHSRVAFEAWGFATTLDAAMTRVARPGTECPPGDSACTASRVRFQLVNAPRPVRMGGGEGLVRVSLPWGFTLRAGVAYAIGDQPNPTPRASASAAAYAERVPSSRIPPLNGTAELRWRHRPTGVYLGSGVRWALAQTRLAPQDLSDARIPLGGTPGYAVLDLRAGWRWREYAVVALVVENVFDAAYRVHGSSVNGPGIGVLLSVSGGL